MKGILVGLGNFSHSWFGVCGDHPEVELVGFVARTQKTRDAFAAKHGLEEAVMFPSLSEAIDACSADFVLDVTPPAAHKDVALAAMAAGLHVLGEKPMCDKLDDARFVADAGKKAGIKHMISQNYRFGALPRTSRRLLSEGTIGDPGQLVVTFYVPWADLPGTHYVREPYMFLTDMGVHHFDMMRFVLGRDPVSVHVQSWNQPWGWHTGDACHVAVFDFPEGLRAVHVAIGCSLGHRTTYNGDWRIEGPEGSLTWEGDKLFLSREHRAEVKQRRELPLDGVPAERQTAVLNEFLNALRENREPECSARDNLRSLAMTFGAVESAISGHRVPLPGSGA